ncbi:hypothetical protein C3488_21030 [Streptomyces sp. Ru72]|nr:hypothetical protein C3488_21030 [Streptomyces sp. Ru72]
MGPPDPERDGARTASLTPAHLTELDALTAPALNFPLPFLKTMGFPAQRGETVIKGVKAGD